MVLAVGGPVPLAHAGSLTGKLELPAVLDRPPVSTKGFLDRVENPLTPVKPLSLGPAMLVVLEGDEKPAAGGIQVAWELAGDSFSRAIIGALVGAEVVIKNTSRTARSLAAAEDPKLIPGGPINPTGPKSFRVATANTYTIGDSDAPHLKGKLVVVNTAFIAHVDETGKFDLSDVPAGSYKLRVYLFHPATGKDGWIDRPDEPVTIPAKGKAEVTAKIPTGYPIAAKAK
ncbi:MAG: hypothetical protein H0T79_03560 [Deltaproteobacteria bacterium]|nr:hypothetical protein [Deltaproteobacteria bacterium]